MENEQKKSLLEELYTDAGEFDVARTVKALKPILSIQRGSQAVFFSKEGHALKNQEKVLAYCLLKKLLKAEAVIEEGGVSAKEVHEKTELPKGTVDPLMQKLKKDGLLAGSGSNYEIPARQVDAILSRLENHSAKK
jgi:hypothetical protein